MHHPGNLNAMVGQGDQKGRLYIQNPRFRTDAGINYPLLSHPMNGERAFGPNFVLSWLKEVDIFDDLPFETGFGEQRGFHVVFMKMLFLQGTVESHELIDVDLKIEKPLFQVQKSIQLITAGPDQLLGGIGKKADLPSVYFIDLTVGGPTGGREQREKKEDAD